MIVDAHCHAWRSWPYGPPASPSSVDHLLRELDAHGIDMALVVAARLNGHDDNNDYVLAAAAAHPDRLLAAVEVDAYWRPEYGTPGASARLERLVDAGGAACLALFPDPRSPGWLPDQGSRLVEIASERGLAVSVAAPPALQADVRAVAAAHPDTPFMLHHLGMASLDDPDSVVAQVEELRRTASHSNVYLKLSGLAYAGADAARVRTEIVAPLVAAFGAPRLLWGSDFPSSLRFGAGYGDSLAALEAIEASDRPAVLGQTLSRLLGVNAR